MRPNLVACRRNLDAAIARQTAWMLSFRAVDCGFIQYYPLGKGSNLLSGTVPRLPAFAQAVFVAVLGGRPE